MELDDWEYLPNDHELFHIHANETNDKISPSSNPISVVDMNYFQTFVDPQQKITNTIEIPCDEKETFIQDNEDDTKHSKSFEESSISKVFIKEMKENDQFVDMKMELLPKSVNQQDVMVESGLKIKEDHGGGGGGGCGGGGGDVWKWAMSGIGAVVSFGVAAATVSLIVLGNYSREEHYKGPKIHCQIYPHDKRINQVVHHAKKLNEAIRGASMTRAHITIGGYYDGL